MKLLLILMAISIVTGIALADTDYVNNASAKKQAENDFLNSFFIMIKAIFGLMVLGLLMFLLRKLGKI